MIYWISAVIFRAQSVVTRKSRGKLYAGIFSLALVIPGYLVFSIWQHDVIRPPLPAHKTPAGQTPLTPAGAVAAVYSGGDLQAIKQRGQLRVLLQRPGSSSLRTGAAEKALIRQYARQQGLEINWVKVGRASQLPGYLQQGRGDLVLTASAFIPPGSRPQLQLTLPWGVSQQKVIFRSDTSRIDKVEDLLTRQVAIKRSSPAWEKLSALARANASMDLLVIPETTSNQSILQRVASAEYDVTVLDNLAVETLLPAFLNLEVAFNITRAKTISWAVRSTATELRVSVDNFLKKHYLHSAIARSYREDLPGLQTKKLLRLITCQSPVNYYLRQGKLRGFEHDLMKRFATSHNMRLDIVIAESHEELRDLLLAGKGDVVAASVPRQSFAVHPQVTFTRAYKHAAPVVVGRTKDTPLLDIRALAGRRVVLPAASPYENLLQKVKAGGIDVDIVIADAGETAETILQRVARGMYDLTVTGGDVLKAQLRRQINLRAHFVLTEPLAQVWMVRAGDTQLLSALNEFIAKEFRKGFYNVLYAKYIENPASPLGDTQLVARAEQLSPYDKIVHKYADHYGFDWRLIVAQMYQESQFDPHAISYAGAEGLMQLIPETARLLGIADAYDPQNNIRAGVRYLDYLRGKFADDLLLQDRIWFSLAAYNAGYNRVQRARLLAAQMNLDKNKWFNNVEKAMLMLARPDWKGGEIKRKCRCGQAVVYVRDIRTLYNNYVRLTRNVETAANVTELSQDI